MDPTGILASQKNHQPTVGEWARQIQKGRVYGMLNYAQADFSGRHTTRVSWRILEEVALKLKIDFFNEIET